MVGTRSRRHRQPSPSPSPPALTRRDRRSMSQTNVVSTAEAVQSVTQDNSLQNQVTSLTAQVTSLLEMVTRLASNQSPPSQSQAAEKVTNGQSQISESATTNVHEETASVTEVGVASTIKSAANKISPNPVNFNHRRKIATFDGMDSNVRIESWFSVFEVVLRDMDNESKKYELAQHVGKDALTWYADHVAKNMSTMTWDQVKQSFINRFKLQEIRPIIAAQERRLERSETVQKYFDDKMRLLQQTGLDDIDMVAILNRGMPSFYQSHLIASKIKSTSEWLSTALEFESNFKRQEKFRKPKPFSDPKAMVANASKDKTNKSKPQPKACRICIRKGIPDQLHWHSECPHRDPDWKSKKESNQQTVSETTNNTEN